MNEEKKIDPKHTGIRVFLRIAGPVCLLLGGLCLFRAISAFGDVNQFDSTPKYAFGGMFLLFVGLVMTVTGFMGAVARYHAGEVAPVAKDTFNYVAKGTHEGIKSMASAIGQGLAEGQGAAEGKASQSLVVLRCHKCNNENDSDAKFCRECGTALARSKPCGGCGELNDPDARFCDNCGKAFEG